MEATAAMITASEKTAPAINHLAVARTGLAILSAGLILSGLTCYFLPGELTVIGNIAKALPLEGIPLLGEYTRFLIHTREGVQFAAEKYPQLFLGTDYLGFAHILLGILFIGAIRDPVRNKWVVEFGVIACVLVIPAAFLFGFLRGAPLLHYFVDASFGVVAMVFLIRALHAVREITRTA